MPLLDIATSQPSFRNQLGASRAQPLLHGNILGRFISGKEKRLISAWKVYIRIPRKAHFNGGHLGMRGTLLVKAVTTLEPKYLVHSEDEHKDDHNLQSGPDSSPQVSQSGSEDSIEMDERESLRRMRISKANKGNVPWNKGRKHSAETLRRIKERTKLAMQDPKVKMKLINLGHAQSDETRIKIGVGVRMGWQRRREKLMLQESCYFEWQNLIAEASRGGYASEEELHWDSYRILDEQLEQEWLESIKQRKLMPRPKGSKRAPKSLEQRRKISEAISSKWADPGYRERVCSALAKYHGTPVGAKRKPRRRPRQETPPIRSPMKKKASEPYSGGDTSESKSQFRSRLKKSSAPSYKDPLANSKLEMIKKIREQRAAMETKKREAMERAKLLIAEAEKAAKALEVAATKSPLARASLLETRKLIAEATRSIEAVETGQILSHESKNISSFESNGLANHFEEGNDTGNKSQVPPDEREVNGTHVSMLSNSNNDFYFSKFALQNLLNNKEPLPSSPSWETSSAQYVLAPLQPNGTIKQSYSAEQQVGQLKLNGAIKYCKTPRLNGDKIQAENAKTSSNSATKSKKKKWVCGRLVEVEED